MPRDQELEGLVSEFVQKMSTVLQERTRRNVQAMLAPLMQGSPIDVMSGVTMRSRAPQLCPVPGCQNTAAPRYGMVCVQHKDLPKAEIKKFREARKADVKAEKVAARATSNGSHPMLPSMAPKKGGGRRVPVR